MWHATCDNSDLILSGTGTGYLGIIEYRYVPPVTLSVCGTLPLPTGTRYLVPGNTLTYGS